VIILLTVTASVTHCTRKSKPRISCNIQSKAFGKLLKDSCLYQQFQANAETAVICYGNKSQWSLQLLIIGALKGSYIACHRSGPEQKKVKEKTQGTKAVTCIQKRLTRKIHIK